MMKQNGNGSINPVWQPQAAAAEVVERLVEEFCQRSPAICGLRQKMLERTGTRLIDWIDHLTLKDRPALDDQLSAAGFTVQSGGQRLIWQHAGGLFPTICVEPNRAETLAVSVDSIAQFLMIHASAKQCDIQGTPLSPFRTCPVDQETDPELWIVERHGVRGFEPVEMPAGQHTLILKHREQLLTRRRWFPDESLGFEHASQLIDQAKADLGTDWTCDAFFAAERQYWQSRNRAARIQKARQDALGLGWANHDHHTFRSSRQHFRRLIHLLEQLGFSCRERFYGGRDAGWGAQVLEQPQCGIVVFADVDLTPDEVTGDFAHEGLAAQDQLGTVGLWCLLHGEAILEAGMHHLECQFSFDHARRQLAQESVSTMAPFTDLPYLKQAFTEGEVWPVREERLDIALARGCIDQTQAQRFRSAGTIGSHLEILQRDAGYKGFNQSGISEIIRDTDPRRA